MQVRRPIDNFVQVFVSPQVVAIAVYHTMSLLTSILLRDWSNSKNAKTTNKAIGFLSTVHYYKASPLILMDTQYSPNDLQRHKVLSGASDLLDKPLYQSGRLILLCRQGCLEGGDLNNGLFQICIT